MVVPLQRIILPNGTNAKFAHDLVLCETPSWLKDDYVFTRLSDHEQYTIKSGKYSFVADHDESPEAQIDELKRQRTEPPRHERDTRYATLANFALWLAQPSAACFTLLFHGPRSLSEHHVESVGRQNELYCHPEDEQKHISTTDLQLAGRLHSSLVNLSFGTSVWLAVRSTWAALTTGVDDLRYPLFWIALEAIFGPDDYEPGLSGILARRISIFTAEKPKFVTPIHEEATKCYELRSKILHGRWDNSAPIEQLMMSTETIIRKVFVRLLTESQLLATINSVNRDGFLKDWASSKAGTQPPYPV